LPASPLTLALYLTQLAELGRKYSSIRRARTSIGQVHAAANLSRPDRDARIRTLERGIGRTIGTREQGARPLCVAELERAVNTLHDTARDVRDRALLLLGFTGGYRAGDLAILDRKHVVIASNVLKVFLPRSKEDQLGKGRTTKFVARDNHALCPLRALERWLAVSPDCAGPLFRVVHGSRIEREPIHPRAVSRAVQRAVKRAELAGDYSAHSLRACAPGLRHQRAHMGTPCAPSRSTWARSMPEHPAGTLMGFLGALETSCPAFYESLLAGPDAFSTKPEPAPQPRSTSAHEKGS
jgi:integrase